MEIFLKDLNFQNKDFWAYQIATQYSMGCEEYDTDMSEIMSELLDVNIQWMDDFTQFYDGVFEDNDGYLDNPTFVTLKTSANDIYKIEYHPGDTLYFKNNKKIASTGPHFTSHSLPFNVIEQFLNLENGRVIFLLLLPISTVSDNDKSTAYPLIYQILLSIGIPEDYATKITHCIFEQIIA